MIFPCSGYTDLIVNRTGQKLFANCKDGYIYQYDLTRAKFDRPRKIFGIVTESGT